jgi:hypothetical protein
VRQADTVAVVDGGSSVTALYDVVLLDGSPRRLPLRLAADIERESVIQVEGEAWLVADVRPMPHGPAQLICIHADS